jgi:TDG/mug DNA glycosylase family protein
MDGSIIEKGAVPNDLDGFFRDHPTVRIICFNGQKAEKLFRRLVLPGLSWLPQSITQKTLPSTSPAYASLNLPEKAAKWALALGVADPSGHLE